MKIGVIVQARMGSSRFPGKCLFKVNGKPMLEYLLDRLSLVGGIDKIVIATSDEDRDAPIAEYGREKGYEVFRGDHLNVARRFMSVIEKYGFDAFIRISGDSPLLDQRLVGMAMDVFKNGNFDMVTNIETRTFPQGESIEILRTEAFRSALPKMSENDDLEHVTKYFYKNRNGFTIKNIRAEKKYDGIKLSVDTSDDMEIFKKIAAKMTKPHYEYGLDEIVEIYRSVAGLS